jgi:uncharacterized membrane protein YvbJ
MFCPNCGKENSTEQKFCRACGIGLEKTVESLMEQKLSPAQSDNLLRKRILLETFGTVATGGLITVIVIAVSAVIYTILMKMILTGTSVLFGILLTAFIIFALLTLIYVGFNASLKEKQNKRKLPVNELDGQKNANGLLEEKPFEPALSVTEHSTELLYTKNKTQKL